MGKGGYEVGGGYVVEDTDVRWEKFVATTSRGWQNIRPNKDVWSCGKKEEN